MAGNSLAPPEAKSPTVMLLCDDGERQPDVRSEARFKRDDKLKTDPKMKTCREPLQPEFKLKQDVSQQEDTVLLLFYCMKELWYSVVYNRLSALNPRGFCNKLAA